MEFKQYMHIEKFGNTEVENIELGKCFIFPKIDGTNGSIWFNGELQAGSRKRQLSLENDNAGFYKFVLENSDKFMKFFIQYPNLRLFGEFLVPHSLRTYKDDAWRNFYVFDVFDDKKEQYIPYNEYQLLIEQFDINFIPAIAMYPGGVSYEFLLIDFVCNHYLIKDGEECGEGIVIKNYDYKNKYNRVAWAKIITNKFKEERIRKIGKPTKRSKAISTKRQKVSIEQKICDVYITSHFINKVYTKIVNEKDGWSSKYISRLLSTIYYDLIKEELWDIIKNNKNPTINFKRLNGLIINKVKENKPELFK